MKTITYNPETHALVPRDLIADAKQIFCSDVEPNTNGDCLDVIDWFANYDGEHVYDLTHWMPLPKPPAIDAAMSQGEQE